MEHFVTFPYTFTCEQETNMVWWLAKFAWYDVTWKPPIQSAYLLKEPISEQGTKLECMKWHNTSSLCLSISRNNGTLDKRTKMVS